MLLHLSNFINAYAHVADIQSLPDVKKVLLIGVGTGLEVAVLKWLGYHVTTMDMDERKHPDVHCYVQSLHEYDYLRFDCIIASHVLEHVPPFHFSTMTATMARMGKYALIYLPVYGKQLQARLYHWQVTLDLFTWLNPYGSKDPQHFWELGQPEWKLKDVLQRLSEQFIVLRHYRNADWPVSYNFVLQSKTKEESHVVRL